MVDPNRKINLHQTEDSDEEDEFYDEHVQMVKEFESEFKNRFTEQDEEFQKFLQQKTKPPIIVYPFDVFHRGGGHHGHGGGPSRYNNRGGRNNYHPYNRGHQDNHRRNNYNQQNRYHNQQQPRPYDQRDNKRFRRDDS